MPGSPYVITVSRQLGSGGSYVGQQLAARLGIAYVDREITRRAAEQLKTVEEDIEAREEKKTSFWKRLLQTCALGSSDAYLPPEIIIVDDRDLYQAESEIIQRIAAECSAVIIGRGGFYFLRQQARHLSVFLHAELPCRQRRVEELYHVSGPEAKRLIEQSDRERGRYIQALTGRDWNDARQYHLAIDTSAIELNDAVNFILSSAKSRFGDLTK